LNSHLRRHALQDGHAQRRGNRQGNAIIALAVKTELALRRPPGLFWQGVYGSFRFTN
jgi:hypothetical protein